jgi:ankyrin repeat protein
VDVNLRNGNGDSVLSLAAGKGLTEVVVAVLALLPPPSPPSSQQQQQQEGGAAASAAVAVAASSSSLVNSPNKHGISPLGGAVAFGGGGGSPFAAGAAPPNGSSFGDGGQGGAAAGSGGAEGSGVQEEEAACVKALLLAGADCLEHRDMNGANCLMVAAHCSNAAATKAILQYLLHKPKQQPEQREEGQAEGGDSSLPTSEGKHAYLEAADENGATAVWLAAAAGSAEVVSLLLQAGAGALFFVAFAGVRLGKNKQFFYVLGSFTCVPFLVIFLGLSAQFPLIVTTLAPHSSLSPHYQLPHPPCSLSGQPSLSFCTRCLWRLTWGVVCIGRSV